MYQGGIHLKKGVIVSFVGLIFIITLLIIELQESQMTYYKLDTQLGDLNLNHFRIVAGGGQLIIPGGYELQPLVAEEMTELSFTTTLNQTMIYSSLMSGFEDAFTSEWSDRTLKLEQFDFKHENINVKPSDSLNITLSYYLDNELQTVRKSFSMDELAYDFT